MSREMTNVEWLRAMVNHMEDGEAKDIMMASIPKEPSEEEKKAIDREFKNAIRETFI